MPKTQSIAEAAKAAIPGYTDAKRYLDTLTRWKAEHPRFAEVADPFEEFRAAARAGGELPADVGQRINDSERAILAHQRTAAEIVNAHSEARNEVANVLRDGADYALEHLHREILKRQDTIREAAKTLDGVTSSDQAMRNATHREAWGQLAAAVDDVDQIRTTQWSLYKDRAGSGEGWYDVKVKYASVAFLTNALDYDPELVAYRHQQARRIRPDRFPELEEHATWLTSTPATPWPKADYDSPWWPTDDHTGYLMWATRVTSLWVPTIDQIQDAHDAAIGAALDVGNGGNKYLAGTTYREDEAGHLTRARETTIGRGLEQAKEDRARYYKITGGTPTTESPALTELVW